MSNPIVISTKRSAWRDLTRFLDYARNDRGLLQVIVILHTKRGGLHIARVESTLQPTLALVAGAVGKRFGSCPTLRLLL